MALDPCVRAVLCTLTEPTLLSLRATVQANVVNIQALLTALQARGALLGIQSALIAVPRDAALAVLQEAEAVTSFVPLPLLNGCPNLGELVTDYTAAMRRYTSSVQDFADDLTRTLSLSLSVEADIAELQAQLTSFNEWLDEISFCLTQVQTT